MSAEGLRHALAEAAKLYDEDDGLRPDELWTADAATALLGLMDEMRATPTVAGVLLIPVEWYRKGASA